MLPVEFRDKVAAHLSDKPWYELPCHVLVAVSGGADSMALLHTLLHWPQDGLHVSAVHVHHGLRGDNADRDEHFVRDYCRKHNVELLIYYENVAEYAQAHKLSLEAAGRRIRYDRFEEARAQLGADRVATAHTASDRAETTLMRIIRGTGTDGLTGIPEARGWICRPLLGCTRSEVEQYCEQCHIPYVNDETNTDMAFTRNRIRNHVLPMLRELNPAVEDALLRLAEQAGQDSDCLLTAARTHLQEAAKTNGYDVSAFKQEVLPVKRRMITLMMRDASVPSFEQTHIFAAEKAIDSGRGDVLLPDGYIFSVSQGVAAVRFNNDVVSPLPIELHCLPVKSLFGEYALDVRVKCADDGFVHNLFSNTVLDYAKIDGNLQIRCRQEGDEIHPVGRGVGKSIKKLMNECRIPAYTRDSFPLLCDDTGVIMVPGYAVDERVRVTDATNHYLVCECEKTTH